MTTRPILFSAEMVRALLDNRKTQTRRVVKPGPLARRYHAQQCYLADRWSVEPHPHGGWWAVDVPGGIPAAMTDDARCRPDTKGFACPYGAPGDRLYVKERYALAKAFDGVPSSQVDHAEAVDYEPFPQFAGRHRCSRFMPRWASRITLELTAVRVERVQAISEADAVAEGVGPIIPTEAEWWMPDRPYASMYRLLWDSLNAKRGYGWASNPFVWVLTVKRATP